MRPLVVAGPSGVGKGTLLQMLRTAFPTAFANSVSYTSRSPRPSEKHGDHYYFVSKDTFLEKVERKEFVEYAHSFGNMYGTAVEEIERLQKLGKICVLEIDVQGVRQIKSTDIGKDANYLFIVPPSMEELERRLRARGTDKEDKIKHRLEVATREMEECDKLGFSKVIKNDDLEKSFQELRTQVLDWYPCLGKQ